MSSKSLKKSGGNNIKKIIKKVEKKMVEKKSGSKKVGEKNQKN